MEEISCFIQYLPWLSNGSYNNELRYIVLPQTTQIVEAIIHGL